MVLTTAVAVGIGGIGICAALSYVLDRFAALCLRSDGALNPVRTDEHRNLGL